MIKRPYRYLWTNIPLKIEFIIFSISSWFSWSWNRNKKNKKENCNTGHFIWNVKSSNYFKLLFILILSTYQPLLSSLHLYPQNKVSLYSPGSPGTCFIEQTDLKCTEICLPLSLILVLGLKTHATTDQVVINLFLTVPLMSKVISRSSIVLSHWLWNLSSLHTYVLEKNKEEVVNFGQLCISMEQSIFWIIIQVYTFLQTRFLA